MKSEILNALIVKSPLHKPLLNFRSKLEYKKIIKNNNTLSQTKAYCISPFKTGTTFLTNAFSEYNQVAHEPFQYTTINRMNDSEFLKMRSSYLNLDLECSGFFSPQYNKILEYNPTAKLVSIYREPESWINSVINYFIKIDKNISYNYIPRLFFDKYTVYPIEKFFELTAHKQETVINGLLELWALCYTLKNKDDKILVIHLENLDDELHKIEDYLELKAHSTKSTWKRSNNKKEKISIHDFINNDEYLTVLNSADFSNKE